MRIISHVTCGSLAVFGFHQNVSINPQVKHTSSVHQLMSCEVKNLFVINKYLKKNPYCCREKKVVSSE